MGKNIKILIMLFVSIVLLQQCENSTKSQVEPEIIFSNPHYTVTSLDSNKIEYNIDLEFLVTTK